MSEVLRGRSKQKLGSRSMDHGTERSDLRRQLLARATAKEKNRAARVRALTQRRMQEKAERRSRGGGRGEKREGRRRGRRRIAPRRNALRVTLARLLARRSAVASNKLEPGKTSYIGKLRAAVHQRLLSPSRNYNFSVDHTILPAESIARGLTARSEQIPLFLLSVAGEASSEAIWRLAKPFSIHQTRFSSSPRRESDTVE